MHYLDNSATTKPEQCTVDEMVKAAGFFGNPSSTYELGYESHSYLEACRDEVRQALGVPHLSRDMIVFTASGTEANNLAILGFDYAKNRVRSGKAPVILTTDGEHPSVENPALRLESKGYRYIRIPTAKGVLDLEFLKDVLKKSGDDIVLAAMMLVNNETGAVYDVKAASRMIKSVCPKAHVHCDAVQAFTKLEFTPSSLGVDSLTVSSHKIHAPRGAGALYISAKAVKRKDIAPVLPGGGQENGFRSGTENLTSIGAFARGCAFQMKHFQEHRDRVSSLRNYLLSSLEPLTSKGLKIKDVRNQLDDIINITLPGIKSETMLNHLSEKEVYVSAGSACSARSGKMSHALLAFGSTKDEADSSLRISLSYDNSEEDIDALAAGLDEGISKLVKYKL